SPRRSSTRSTSLAAAASTTPRASPGARAARPCSPGTSRAPNAGFFAIRSRSSPPGRTALVEYPLVSHEEPKHARWTLYVPRGRRLVAAAALAGAYYGSAKIGSELEFVGPVAAIVWPPVGVGIAFLYLGGAQLWPGVVVGDLLANNYMTLPIGSALGQTVGNTL